MGRPWKGKSQANNPGRKKKGKHVPDFNEDELDDAIDKFHKSKDKINLDVDDDNELSDEDIEEPVFDLQAKSSDEEDDDGESDDEDLDEEELSGLAAKMAKQQKILRQKTHLMENEEDEEEDEEEKVKEKKAPWGKRKKAYYDADNVDYELQSSDEESPAEEEAEALRLQRLRAESLQPEDFELSGDDDEKSLQEVADKQEANGTNLISVKGRRAAIKIADANMLVEEVKKDVSALSKEEQMNVVMSDAPELEGLLAELRQSLDELNNQIEPALSKVKKISSANKGGLMFLETKHMLLLCYCQSIVFYLLMKAEGRSVRDHPVIARLVEIRTLLEKLQPNDQKLQKQIDKLIDTPIETSFLLKSKEIVNHCASGDDKQIVDKCVTQTNGSSMENGKSKRKQHIELTKIVEGRQKLTKRKNGELKNIPDVIHPDFFERVDNIQQAKLRRLAECEDDDMVLPANKHLNKIISSKVQTKKKQMISGDMDLPVREELGERRSKFEMRRLPSNDDVDDIDDMEEMDGSQEGEEDEFYKEAKRLKTMKKAMKDNNNKITTSQEPMVEEEVGKRHITYDMEKNKGLTPHRKKLTKNPRKKYKLKHQKAVIRRKGQVRDIRKPSGPYSGESTGIRTGISRSVRFHS